MDLIQLAIPWNFIRERCSLGWREMLFGLDKGLIDASVPVQKAIDELGVGTDANPGVLKLACQEPAESVRATLEDLSASEPVKAEEEVRDAWLFLVLAWMYEYRHGLADPLQQVEVVYADFGYPPQMEDFVRYMPSDAPDLGSREMNESRLIERWRRFVEEQSIRFRNSDSAR